jgi:hypothetical protein
MIDNENQEQKLDQEIEKDQDISSSEKEIVKPQLPILPDRDLKANQINAETEELTPQSINESLEEETPLIETPLEEETLEEEIYPPKLESLIEETPFSNPSLEQINSDTVEEKPNPQSFPKEKKSFISTYSGFLIGIFIAIIVIGGGVIVAQLALNTLKSSDSVTPFGTTEPIDSPPSGTDNVATPQIQVFWLENKDNQMGLFSRGITVDQGDSPQDSLRSAFGRLLAGSNNPDYFSEIPQGTKLLSLRVLGENIYIDLSNEFTTGGGTASMTGRLAQVLYTATSLDPNAQIFLSIEGETLEVLGGEGLMVDQPLTRTNFQANFPF